LLNDRDLGYAKIRFDATSRAALHRTVSELTDPLPRALIWGAVTDAVRDADVPVTDLVDLFVAGIAFESEVTVVRDLIRYATARPIDAQFPNTGLAARYAPPPLVPALQARVAQACWAAMVGTDPAGGRRILFARGYVAAAGEADGQRLRTWLDDPRAAGADGVDVDAEMRWAILTRLAALGAVGEDEIAVELDRDRSASGAEHAARCRAVRPDPTAKATAWRTIMEGDNLSNRLVTAAAEGLWHPGQLDLMESYVERYFADLPVLATRRTPAVVAQVAAAAFPRYAVTAQTLAQAQDLLAQPALDPTLNRVVVDQADELRRALAGRVMVERALAEPEVGHGDAG
jgi:aminopeptidase N